MTITLDDTDVREDIIEDTEKKNDQPEPCIMIDVCGNDAQFIYRRKCCGALLYICSDCIIDLMDLMKSEDYQKGFHCVLCHAAFISEDFLDYVGPVT